MSVTRINRFQAREGQGDALRDHIKSFVPIIEASEGCQSCQLLQNQDEPEQIVVIEVWDSVEAHQASVQNIPQDAMHKAMQLLDGTPKGGYYRAK